MKHKKVKLHIIHLFNNLVNRHGEGFVTRLPSREIVDSKILCYQFTTRYKITDET